MKNHLLFCIAALLVVSRVTIPLGAQQGISVLSSKHNLSASGPGPFKAQTETRVCIFCHAPHRARSGAPLWNRSDSQQTYLAYSSTTFGGVTGQPAGGSKLCLSCHDGSLALGAIQSEPAEIGMTAGHRFLDTGFGFLGTSLDDDHPISFDYSTSKGGSGLEYLPPSSITPPVHLDENAQVQCTSCHDAHDNALGDFLLTSDRNGSLCVSCHIPDGWIASSHATSAATWSGAGANPWPRANYASVSENACANCHVPHGAAGPQRLLAFQLEEDNCLNCHTGNVATKDISQDLSKPYSHSPFGTVGVHDPSEDPLSMPRHAECQDCHAPHQVRPGSAAAPGVPGPNTGTPGIGTAGVPVDSITFLYELCYRCHADNNGGTAIVPRWIQQTNTRLEFDPANPSFHPIESAGKNTDMPSLLPPWTTASRLACTDCHASDSSPQAGGSGPAGPHGSIYSPLLLANYNTQDGIQESPSEYALCYRCHNRSSILGGDSFKEHDKHVRKEKISCAACHDAHGISSSQGNSTNNTNLINFDSNLVSPSPKTGQLFFRDDGFRAGTCSLKCHGKDHHPESYKP